MSTNTIMARLRRANPVPEAPAGEGGELFARITALPGDPRLTEGQPRRPASRRRNAIALVFVLGIAALLASTAFAISHWIGGDVVRPPVTRQEYLDAQKQLTLPPGVSWPTFDMPGANTVTSRGGGGGQAVLTAQNAWECYWVRAIRKGDSTAVKQAQDELNRLLETNVVVAPIGAPEGWTPSPPPEVPFAVFAHDGGLNWVRSAYTHAAAGDPRNLIASCRANAPN
jgi:hypothetical protein